MNASNAEPTPHDAYLLAGLLADRGVELRVSPGGELQLRDQDNRLSPADRATVRRYADVLADWLAEPARKPTQTDTPEEPEPFNKKVPRCDRCRCTEFVEVPIHDGASIRRDCARCGRTWGFPVWYGEAVSGAE